MQHTQAVGTGGAETDLDRVAWIEKRPLLGPSIGKGPGPRTQKTIGGDGEARTLLLQSLPPDPSTYTPEERQGLLIKADALIAAEIDRLRDAIGDNVARSPSVSECETLKGTSMTCLELRAEAEVSNTEKLRIAQTCEEFERAVRQMLVAATPTPEEEVPDEEEKHAAQGAQEDEQEM